MERNAFGVPEETSAVELLNESEKINTDLLERLSPYNMVFVAEKYGRTKPVGEKRSYEEWDRRLCKRLFELLDDL